MSERDMLIERLEKKLIEKEKELVELRRMLSEKTDFEEKFKQRIIDELKKEIHSGFSESNLAERISEIESKVVELRRAVESLMGEVVYLKNEIKELSGRNESEMVIQHEERADKASPPVQNSGDALVISDKVLSESRKSKDLTSKEEQKRERKRRRTLFVDSDVLRDEESKFRGEKERTKYLEVGEDEDDLIICD